MKIVFILIYCLFVCSCSEDSDQPPINLEQNTSAEKKLDIGNEWSNAPMNSYLFKRQPGIAAQTEDIFFNVEHAGEIIIRTDTKLVDNQCPNEVSDNLEENLNITFSYYSFDSIENKLIEVTYPHGGGKEFVRRFAVDEGEKIKISIRLYSTEECFELYVFKHAILTHLK